MEPQPVMKLCDEVAGPAAIRHARCRVVTAAMDRMTSLEPMTALDDDGRPTEVPPLRGEQLKRVREAEVV